MLHISVLPVSFFFRGKETCASKICETTDVCKQIKLYFSERKFRNVCSQCEYFSIAEHDHSFS